MPVVRKTCGRRADAVIDHMATVMMQPPPQRLAVDVAGDDRQAAVARMAFAVSPVPQAASSYVDPTVEAVRSVGVSRSTGQRLSPDSSSRQDQQLPVIRGIAGGRGASVAPHARSFSATSATSSSDRPTTNSGSLVTSPPDRCAPGRTHRRGGGRHAFTDMSAADEESESRGGMSQRPDAASLIEDDAAAEDAAPTPSFERLTNLASRIRTKAEGTLARRRRPPHVERELLSIEADDREGSAGEFPQVTVDVVPSAAPPAPLPPTLADGTYAAAAAVDFRRAADPSALEPPTPTHSAVRRSRVLGSSELRTFVGPGDTVDPRSNEAAGVDHGAAASGRISLRANASAIDMTTSPTVVADADHLPAFDSDRRVALCTPLHRTSQWHRALLSWDCSPRDECRDMWLESCLLSWCQAHRQLDLLHDDESPFFRSVAPRVLCDAFFLFYAPCAPASLLSAWQIRQLLRIRYRIHAKPSSSYSSLAIGGGGGECVQDVCAVIWCRCCVVYQHYVEMTHHGDWPGNTFGDRPPPCTLVLPSFANAAALNASMHGRHLS